MSRFLRALGQSGKILRMNYSADRRLFWLDAEMTGLDYAGKDRIMEIACLVTGTGYETEKNIFFFDNFWKVCRNSGY